MGDLIPFPPRRQSRAFAVRRVGDSVQIVIGDEPRAVELWFSVDEAETWARWVMQAVEMVAGQRGEK